MVTVAIPLLVLAFYGVRRHYRRVARRLRAKGRAVARSREPRTTSSSTSSGSTPRRARRSGTRGRSRQSLRAIHVPFPGSDPGIGPRFSTGPTASPPRDPARRGRPARRGDRRGLGAPARRVRLRHGRRARALPQAVAALGGDPAHDVPAEAPAAARAGRRDHGRPDSATTTSEPQRARGRRPVSGVHAASLRAVLYARSLGIDDTQAVFFAFDDDEAAPIEHEWRRVRDRRPARDRRGALPRPRRRRCSPTCARSPPTRKRSPSSSCPSSSSAAPPAAAQPARALPQAAAALRAAGDPDAVPYQLN